MFRSLIAPAVLALALGGCSDVSLFHSPDGRYTAMCTARFGIDRGVEQVFDDYGSCQRSYMAAGYLDGPAPGGRAAPLPPYPIPTPVAPPAP